MRQERGIAFILARTSVISGEYSRSFMSAGKNRSNSSPVSNAPYDSAVSKAQGRIVLFPMKEG
jgi:hypothetical protein